MTSSLMFRALLALATGVATVRVAAPQQLLSAWTMQSSAATAATGAQISQPAFDDAGWYPVTLPATVLAGLLQNGVYTEPFYSKNLSNINATEFAVGWWYRWVRGHGPVAVCPIVGLCRLAFSTGCGACIHGRTATLLRVRGWLQGGLHGERPEPAAHLHRPQLRR